MMDDTSNLGLLIGVISTVIASIFGAMTWTQKTLVQVLKDQIAGGEKREIALSLDNKEQALTISKMGVSVDKLTEQGSQTIRLLEDVVYGRQQAQQQRRNP
jgi:flagellar biosynthesis/type III secretory pathway M-ring protein FliF/YscJ